MGLLVTARDTTGTTKMKLLLNITIQDNRQISHHYWHDPGFYLFFDRSKMGAGAEETQWPLAEAAEYRR